MELYPWQLHVCFKTDLSRYSTTELQRVHLALYLWYGFVSRLVIFCLAYCPYHMTYHTYHRSITWLGNFESALFYCKKSQKEVKILGKTSKVKTDRHVLKKAMSRPWSLLFLVSSYTRTQEQISRVRSLVVSDLHSDTKAGTYVLPMCRGELSAAIARLMFKCLWGGWKW